MSPTFAEPSVIVLDGRCHDFTRTTLKIESKSEKFLKKFNITGTRTEISEKILGKITG
jgi:hypothetical protein